MIIEKDINYLFFEKMLPDQKEWYSVKEAAAILGCSDQYVRDCFDNQKLLGHIWNAKAKRGQEKRCRYHISRQSLVLFFMETANYHARDFLQRIQKLEQRYGDVNNF